MSLTFEIGFDEAQGRRDTMEDTHVIIDHAEKPLADGPLGFFGVYDGHGGVDAAQMVRQYLHENIIGNDEWRSGDVERAIQRGFEATDSHIIQVSNEKGWMNGSTAVVGMIIGRKLYAANVGDSEAILVREKGGQLETFALTVPHKASDPTEKSRIEKLGGHVFFGRVFGALAVSRSFGDSKFKIPRTSQNFVSWEPAIVTVDLNPDTDKFLIFACDGLWDVINHKQAALFVTKRRQDGFKAPEIAKALVREALNKRTEDNVTVVIVFLQWTQEKSDNDSVENSTSETTTQDQNHEIPEKNLSDNNIGESHPTVHEQTVEEKKQDVHEDPNGVESDNKNDSHIVA
eukprot:TRINITY_DN434_c0_g1_i1.p1 TRINITY_DN434_c0_g1~~TRINITY_DN434_c0_g1_i1.p1  ORF type:complete len:345 (+),score=89.51 TRINITY_DN434_c0_g1_i1:84-1118(+)